MSVWADKSELVTKNAAGATLSFSTSGSYEWEWDDASQRLRSTNCNVHSSTSETTITFTVVRRCDFSFDYAVSSETSYDKLTITLDGNTVVNAISGNSSRSYSGELSEGNHSLVLTYTKDGGDSWGDDRGYVSNMQFAKQMPMVFGDYNGDGQITVEDLAHLANMITGKEPLKLFIDGQFKDEIKVESIALSETSILVGLGYSATLSATASPADATDKTLLWSSSAPEIATVENGVVHGITVGSAIITVMADDGSGVTNTCAVNVIETTGTVDGFEYVDLGMVIKGKRVVWATRNVGAKSPEQWGLYFAWGDTEGHGSETTGETNEFGDPVCADGYSFDWSTAPFNNGSSVYDGTYFNSVKDEVYPNGVLAPEYDAAHVNWKGDWRMPTKNELDWLYDNCTWTWDSTKNGYTVTSKTTGASIFLPSAGERSGSSLYGAGSWGCYYSSSLHAYILDGAGYLFFNSSRRSVYNGGGYDRGYGRSIRPVCVLSE